MLRLGLSCFPASQIRKQSDKKFLSLNPKYEKIYFLFIFGGVLGALTLNPGERKFQGSKISSQSRHIYKQGKKIITCSSYVVPNVKKMRILGYSGVPGWPIDNRSGPILLTSYPLTYINLHIKYGSNLLSYRENDEVSADAAAAA